MQKIFFIYPPSVIMNREDRCQQPVKELLTIPPLPPTDLMYLAAIAQNLGFECKIKDYSIKNESLNDFINDIKEFQPDYLVLNVTTPTLNDDLSILSEAKRILPNLITIAKGAYFLTFADTTLKNFTNLDLIIRGEAEYTFKEILEGINYADIKGLTYRVNNHIISNEKREFIKNLDELPFPARNLVDMDIYRRPDNNKKQAVIKVSRGCPYHCFFCLATPVSGNVVRMRSVDNIVNEIIECKQKYNIKNFLFWSDMFNINKNWTEKLCKKIIELHLNITWSSNTRADTADADMAKLMYKSGCRLVSLGIESGSAFMLDKMGKKITLEQIKQTVQIFKKAKIKIYGYFVLGLPWEDKVTAKKSINFAKELDLDYVNFYTATALPGTKFYDYIKENNLIEENMYQSAYFYPSVKTHYLNKEEVFELHKLADKSFYLRPKFILKTLLNIHSLTELKNYFIAGINLLIKK